MSTFRIHRSYAKALFLLASDLGKSKEVEADMQLVCSVMTENHQLATFFANPTMPADKKMAVLSDLFDSHVSEPTQAFLHFVVRKNRAVNLRGISQAYIEMYREANGIVLVDLVTHQPINDATREQISQRVAHHTGKQPELHDHIDPNMLGGFKLEFDGLMYDARLRTKIRKLRQAFDDNDYESKL